MTLESLNPFGGMKNLYHIQYWSQMEKGSIPPPVLVTIDPTNQCNLDCHWCNAGPKSGNRLTDEEIRQLPEFLFKWGVKAVCIAGGGEPLMHESTPDLIQGLVNYGLEVGIITNGVLLHKNQKICNALSLCKWVGVSVDAGSVNTYNRLKNRDKFLDVLEGITVLRHVAPDLEITYKFLIHPLNINDIESAWEYAKRLRCNYFHVRPVDRTWREIAQGIYQPIFKDIDPADVSRRLHQCHYSNPGYTKMMFNSEKFKLDTFERNLDFRRCRAVGMTCVIQPNQTASLCCDRRGDDRVKLLDWSTLDDIKGAWGSQAHWDVFERINLKDCPRCTYATHNRLYEAFVSRDTFNRNFI